MKKTSSQIRNCIICEAIINKRPTESWPCFLAKHTCGSPKCSAQYRVAAKQVARDYLARHQPLDAALRSWA